MEGRRIAKRVYSTASGGVLGYTRFVYRGAHVGFETDSAGTIGMKYVWGLNIDDLIAFQDGSGNHYYVAKDKLGSIRNVATRSGTWVMRLRHRPYGTLIDSVGSGVQLRYRWTGREWDAELGWYYMRARYYDPVVSRFTQEDPIGFAGGDNLYAYVAGSPLEARDPTGLKAGNVDGPFAGFCFAYGSCVNWDGSLLTTAGPAVYIDGVPVASGWAFYGGMPSAFTPAGSGSLANEVWQQQLNVAGFCSAMNCPKTMSFSERRAFFKKLDDIWKESNAKHAEAGAYLVTNEDGDWEVGPVTWGPAFMDEIDFRTISVPDGAFAKFHTHPDAAPGIPGFPGHTAPDINNQPEGLGSLVWQRDFVYYIRPEDRGKTQQRVPRFK